MTKEELISDAKNHVDALFNAIKAKQDTRIGSTSILEKLSSGELAPIDHSGITDTATLIMHLSREAIATDVYNLRRNAMTKADVLHRQGNMAVFQGLINATGSVIGMGVNMTNQYRAANPGVGQVTGNQVLGWYANRENW